jgi:selenoprotein W-related protein
MAAQPLKVVITYCAECRYEPQTLELAGALMKAFGYKLTGIELVPWHEGSFDVVVNGELVHSMYREGGFPESDDIIRIIKEKLAAPAASA